MADPAAPTMRPIVGAGGIRLAVTERGRGNGPTVVAVHGYPDNQSVWDLVAEDLAADHHVVTYDVRGAGHSDAPERRSDYRLDRLVADFVAVVDDVAPGRRVHLLGHDWGSIQGWAVVTDPVAAARVAGYTSISGPSLDHVGQWLRARRRPGGGRWRQLATQGLHSWYVYAFHTPLAPAAWRRGLGKLWPKVLERRENAPVDDRWPGPHLVDDAVRGIQLYRANMFQVTTRAARRPGRVHTDVPVQLIVPVGDRFVTPSLLDGIEQIAHDLVRRDVGGRHWLPRSRPELVARWTRQHIAAVEGGRRLQPARRGVVVVTGAGSGIGRAVSQAYAGRGAHLVLADIAPGGADETLARCRRLGGDGEAHQVDVADPDAMERFAATVEERHGAPDVVVNNAGIGMAGPFLETTDADWQQILDVNLWGVIRGSRLFAAQMRTAGRPGHIVNVASAAAFMPSRTMSAYATSKAAVLMLTECLRGELADAGIGVSAVCPGFVDTGIATATRYVGVSDADQDANRAAADRMYKRRNVRPETVATAVLRAVDRNLPVVPVAAEARLGLLAQRFAPRLRRAVAAVELRP